MSLYSECESPKATIDAKFGKLALVVTDANHIYATTNPSGGREADLLPWTIRGKEYNFITAHLHRWSDTRFHVGEEKNKNQGFYAGGLYADGLTAFARKQAAPAIEAAVNDYVESHRTVTDYAQVLSLKNTLERLKVKREELSAESRKVVAEIQTTIEAIDAIVGPAGLLRRLDRI